ncbi:MAG: hypothetical protein IAX21_04065 [Candidatus Bathyarchaeota archaeon]|nr:MAG: hypothetical protein IAX21_04065 [Candidatus Bathyarchaeota archaeon]
MKADMKRDTLRRTILELLEKGSKHYTELDKKVCASCHPFATTNTFKSQFNYLLKNDCITRINRGIYQLTSKGEKYLIVLIS